MSPRDLRYPVSVAIARSTARALGSSAGPGAVSGRGPPAQAVTSAAATTTLVARDGFRFLFPGQLGNAFIESPRVMHRAELGPAHRAELGALEVLGRKALVVIFPGAFRIETESELLIPVKSVSSLGQGIVTIARTRASARDIRRVRRDLVRDHALPDILGVREAEVLLCRDVAQHVGAVPPDHRRADRARDMIVARSDIDDEGAEGVERRAMTDLFHAAHVHLDLVHRNVPGPLDHHLHVALPRAPRELAQRIQLGELRAVAGIVQTAGTQRVAERDRHVVLAQDVEDVVVEL